MLLCGGDLGFRRIFLGLLVEIMQWIQHVKTLVPTQLSYHHIPLAHWIIWPDSDHFKGPIKRKDASGRGGRKEVLWLYPLSSIIHYKDVQAGRVQLQMLQMCYFSALWTHNAIFFFLINGWNEWYEISNENLNRSDWNLVQRPAGISEECKHAATIKREPYRI